MAVEIERKYRVLNDAWKSNADSGMEMQQGYLVGAEHASVRVRLHGASANINIKSATLGIRRDEFEYPIPVDDAIHMLAHLCQKPIIKKKRYLVLVGNHQWELDVFEGENDGLVIAEIELTHEDEVFTIPDWLGEEVSHDPRYYNTCLVSHPYKDW
jgi:adenylate cyclase